MKVIFFSGLKGGTGKTTLAVHFCNYIHFYEKKTVCLVSFDRQRVLSLLASKNSSPYLVIETAVEEFGEAFLGGLKQQYIVVDFPEINIESTVIQHWALADVLVLPFLSGELDFYKLLAFFQLANKQDILLKQTFLLPNQFDNKAGATMLQNIQQQAILSSSVLLPPIIKSNKLISIRFLALDSTQMSYVRQSFIYIVDSNKNIVSNIH